MKNMIRLTVLACVCAAALPSFARHGYHHHRGDVAVGAGVLGAGILGAAIINAATRPDTVVVQQPTTVVAPAPVVVQQPVIAAPVVSTGHYETRIQNVWVEGRYVDQVAANGAVIRVWQPGHYEQRAAQVWVP